MKLRSPFAIMLLLSATLVGHAQPNVGATEPDDEAGFQSMFDGTRNGWRNAIEHFESISC